MDLACIFMPISKRLRRRIQSLERTIAHGYGSDLTPFLSYNTCMGQGHDRLHRSDL